MLISECLDAQLAFRADTSAASESELAVVMLKPNYTADHVSDVNQFADEHNLDIVYEQPHLLGRAAVIAIYADILKFSPSDIDFGLDWKRRKLEYMTSAASYVEVLQGQNAQSTCEQYKHDMRQKYGKLSVPSDRLSDDDFEDLAIRNIIHVVDDDVTEIMLWLLMSPEDAAQ